MDIEKILAEAPEGATHCTDTTPSMNLYAKVEHLGGFYVRLSNRWESYPIYAGIHLLDDLREIAKLRAENERLRDDNNALRGYLKVADKQFEDACEKVDFFIKSEQKLRAENEALRKWIAGISCGVQDSYYPIPQWIKGSARRLLESQAAKDKK